MNRIIERSTIQDQDARDTLIVKKVWNEDSEMLNMNEGEATQNCFQVFKKQGSAAEQRCYDAAVKCGNDKGCNAMAVKYAKALEGGYSKDFESFKNKSGALAAAGDIAVNIIGGLFSKIGKGGRDDISLGGGDYYPEQEKTNKGLIIGVSIAAVLGIGITIYFATRNKTATN